MPIAVMTDHAELAAEHARNSFDTPLCVFDEALLEYKLLELEGTEKADNELKIDPDELPFY